MHVQLIRDQEEFYLSYDAQTVVPLDIEGVKNFLVHYLDDSYHNEMKKAKTVLQYKSETPKTVMAFVGEDNNLHICTPELINLVLSSPTVFSYITTDEFAEKHNRKKAIVLRLCREGRIEGAMQVSSVWLIPKDAPYPADARYGARVPSSRTLVQKS